jgi:predicted transcriptional regulator
MGQGSEFERAAPVIIAAVKAGATVAEAAQQAEVPERTVKRWLTDGRRDASGPQGSFAFAIDFIREHREQTKADSTEPVDDAEVQLHISAAIRGGSVPAMKLWTDVYRKRGNDGDEKPADPLGGLDELAAKRAAAGA